MRVLNAFEDVRDWCVRIYASRGELPTTQEVCQRFNICERAAQVHLKRIRQDLSE